MFMQSIADGSVDEIRNRVGGDMVMPLEYSS